MFLKELGEVVDTTMDYDEQISSGSMAFDLLRREPFGSHRKSMEPVGDLIQ